LRLSRVAAPQDAIDQQLTFFCLFGAQVRHPEQVRQHRIVGSRFLQRREQFDNVRRMVQAELAIGGEISRLQIPGLCSQNLRELRDRLGQFVRFVERKSQVQPDGDIRRCNRKCSPVRGNRVLVPAQAHEHNPKIRTCFDVIWMRLKEAAVFGRRVFEFSRILQRCCVVE
jgi:hypothetical protein